MKIHTLPAHQFNCHCSVCTNWQYILVKQKAILQTGPMHRINFPSRIPLLLFPQVMSVWAQQVRRYKKQRCFQHSWNWVFLEYCLFSNQPLPCVFHFFPPILNRKAHHTIAPKLINLPLGVVMHSHPYSLYISTLAHIVCFMINLTLSTLLEYELRTSYIYLYSSSIRKK